MNSVIEILDEVKLPEFKGIRILMMPIHLHDIDNSLPSNLDHWKPTLKKMVEMAPCKSGTAYLTIDECEVQKGDTHRRPGLHVDGWKDDSNAGGWGGGGGWGAQGLGMLIVSSHLGSRGWNQSYLGEPKKFGDCEHLRNQFLTKHAHNFLPNRVYRLDGLTVHESIPLETDCKRQFVRLSMPSEADWNISNTPNPLGIQPEGALVEPRPDEFTKYGNRHDQH
jgi:hypothetical protein